SVLAFNLSRSFQLATTASRRAASRKRRALFRFETIHTLRALCLQRAGLLVHPHGRATLDVGPAAAIKERFKRLDRLLAASSRGRPTRRRSSGPAGSQGEVGVRIAQYRLPPRLVFLITSKLLTARCAEPTMATGSGAIRSRRYTSRQEPRPSS